MIPKAYRWVAEMQEIAAFLEADPAGAAIFAGAAQLYARLAGTGPDAGILQSFASKLEGKV